MEKSIKTLKTTITSSIHRINEMRSKAHIYKTRIEMIYTRNLQNNMAKVMLYHKLSIEVEPRCVSVWKEQWAKRLARVTLLTDFDDQFVIVMDTSNGFWFLPGGEVEQNESIKEAAKREALEELGLKMKINRVIKEFHVTLISKKTKEQLIIPPFTLVHAIPIRGQLNAKYAPNRRIILVKKKDCRKLLHSFKIPIEYECMSPYYYVSKEVVRQLAICST